MGSAGTEPGVASVAVLHEEGGGAGAQTESAFSGIEKLRMPRRKMPGFMT